MTDAILAVYANPADPTREDEFNAWYTDVHIPEVLALDGVVGATRYQLADAQLGSSGDHRYVTSTSSTPRTSKLCSTGSWRAPPAAPSRPTASSSRPCPLGRRGGRRGPSPAAVVVEGNRITSATR
ncbi:MAG: hypothetical protein ABWZ76_10270 [Acidimicrobiales bacterium]